MYQQILKAGHFQANIDRIVYLMVLSFCFFYTTGWAAPTVADSTNKADTLTVHSVDSAESMPASPVEAAGDTASTDADSDYTFSEEYIDETTDKADSTITPDTLPVPPNLKKRSGGGKRFLSLVGALQVLAEKKLKFLSEPTHFLMVHSKKLIILVVSFVIIMLTISFYRERRERGRFMTTTRLSIMDKEVQRACRFIEEHFDDTDLGVELICSELVTGGAFLEALFVKELGLTIDDFIAQVRINRAKIALRKTPDIPSESLALLCGFTEERQFLDRFTAITGCNIDEYCRTLAGNTNESV